MTRHAFSWQVDKYDVIAPEYEDASPMFIECARGTKSGRACFYVRREDADKFFTLESVDITARVYTQEEDSDEWTEGEPIVWKSYIPAERSEVDDYGNVYVTLRDKRWKFECDYFDRPFNQVFIVALEPTLPRTLKTIYEPQWANGGAIPYTLNEILALLFFGTGDWSGIALPSTAVLPAITPDNIQATGTVADIIGRLLYSVGCDLVLDPFTDTLSFVLLSNTQDLATLEAAKTDGKLISKVVKSLQASHRVGSVIVLPATYFPIQHASQEFSSFGDGQKSVNVRDYQLIDEPGYTKPARMTEIKTAVQNWYKAETDLKDETYFGLLKIVPGENLRSITWHLSDDENGHRTHIVNDVVPMEWPKRVEYKTPVMLRGQTFTDINAAATRVKYFETLGGTFTDSGYHIEARTHPGSILSFKDIVVWPEQYGWFAIRVCP